MRSFLSYILSYIVLTLYILLLLLFAYFFTTYKNLPEYQDIGVISFYPYEIIKYEKQDTNKEKPSYYVKYCAYDFRGIEGYTRYYFQKVKSKGEGEALLNGGNLIELNIIEEKGSSHTIKLNSNQTAQNYMTGQKIKYYLFMGATLIFPLFCIFKLFKPRNKKRYKSEPVILVFIALSSYVFFPICSDWSIGFTKICWIIVFYGAIGFGLATMYDAAQRELVYPTVLLLTILGMVGRYTLEYDKFLSILPETVIGIIIYIITIPIFTVMAYRFFVKYLMKGR